jgi:hypothetical protein
MQQAGSHTDDTALKKVANVDLPALGGLRARDVSLVTLCVLVGLLIRLDFMRAAGFTIDGDEAIVGLMGRDILEGRGVPIFYYGQHYMGSLEAIMASLSFAIFGASPYALQLVPLMWSLGLIVLAYWIARLLAGRRAGLIAAALTAVPSPALVVWSSKARGGFIEVVVLGAIALCLTIEWLRHHPERLRYPCALGFVLGIGWWVNNQILYFLLPIGFVCALHTFSRSMRLGAPGGVAGSTYHLWRGVLLIGLVGFLSFLLGGAPYWWYNIRFGFPSAGMFTLASWKQFVGHLEGLSMTALPAIVGAQRFWERTPVFPASRFIAVLLYVVPIALLIVARWRHLVGICKGRIDRGRPVELLVLFCVSCCFVFAVSSYGWLVQAPRYLLPLYIGLYPLVAVCCDWAWSRTRVLGIAYLVALLSFQIASCYVGGRGISGEPMVFGGRRVARDHRPLIETLDRLGITRVRTNYWVGYRLAFETGERVTFTVLGEPTQARIPRYEENNLERRAELPLVLVESEVVVVRPSLKRFGYTFKEERAGEYYILFDLRQELPLTEPIDLKEVGYQLQASGSNPAEAAVDGDPTTRWGTGAPQNPGQRFEIELSEPVSVGGIRYTYGAWFSDRPVELKVEIEDLQGARTVVLSQRESPGAMHLSARDPYFTLRFKPIGARKARHTQIARTPVLDGPTAYVFIIGSGPPPPISPIDQSSTG